MNTPKPNFLVVLTETAAHFLLGGVLRAPRSAPRPPCSSLRGPAAGVDAALAAGMRCVGVGGEDVVAGADLFAPSVAEIDGDHLRAAGPAS